MSEAVVEVADDDEERNASAKAIAWLRERTTASRWDVRRVPLDSMAFWPIGPTDCAIRHRSGRFFSVLGVTVEDEANVTTGQPIIEQSEIGVLGLALRVNQNELQFLLQSKFEPGNINGVQLAPTVQATYSNYTRVHEGRYTEYLDLFGPRFSAQRLVDQVQPEHGAFFLGKFNRNIAVMVDDDVPAHPSYCWTSLTELRRLLLIDNAVGMSLRSVLACVLARLFDRAPERWRGGPRIVPSARWNQVSSPSALHMLHWRTIVAERRCGLDELADWRIVDGALASDLHAPFVVVGVDVTASGREVVRWQQPMFQFDAIGLVAAALRRRDGEPQLLVHAASEVGYRGFRTLAPTHVSYGSFARLAPHGQWFREVCERADATSVLYRTILSEEGGRFRHFQNEYVVLELEDLSPPDATYQWVPVGELLQAVCHGGLSMELRSLLAWVAIELLCEMEMR
jgi:dTDP-4-dehydro-6-deoxy-alpha-D-glucopyranose 2,3-dehydratase